MAEFPAQTKGRARWIVEAVQANQHKVSKLLTLCQLENYCTARALLLTMHKGDRDAMLLKNGILTDEQLEGIKTLR